MSNAKQTLKEIYLENNLERVSVFDTTNIETLVGTNEFKDSFEKEITDASLKEQFGPNETV